MSVRRIPLSMIADAGEVIRLAEFQQMQNAALNTLETCVKEAKAAVHQTKSRVEKLAKSLDEIKGAKKDTKTKRG